MDALTRLALGLVHLLALLVPALGVAALAAAAARWLWRRELAGVGWRALASSAALLAALGLLVGLLVLGRDGRIGGYALLVLGCALGIWWRGFGPGRRG